MLATTTYPIFRTLAVVAVALIGLNAVPVAARSKGGKSHKAHGKRVAHATPAKGGKTARARSHKQFAKRTRNPTKLVMPPAQPSPVLNVAQQYLGQPYRFGASGGAYDCSGFVRRVFGELGVELPHSARSQFDLGNHVAREDLLPGDLVFFRTYKRSASHVGIYIADDKFIHAATRGGQVQVDSLDESYYANRYLGARRVNRQS